MSSETENRERWGSRFGFIMAAAGSAIGLGNIWKFPYITGVNGGGAFVLVYLCCIILVGLPVMITEFGLGRAAQSDPIGVFRKFAPGNSCIPKIMGGYGFGLSTLLFMNGSYGLASLVFVISLLLFFFGWGFAGFSCVFVAGTILSYYAIIGGWILYYAFLAFTKGLEFSQTSMAAAAFVKMAQNGKLCAGLGIVFMVGCGAVCWFGVKKGIELISKLLMPIMLVIILILVVRSLTLPGAMAGLDFYLTPRFSNLSAKGVLEALGHAFYSLSLGMAILVVYGSYLPRDRNIIKAACWVAGLDTLIALLAGLAIFPAVFAMGMKPNAGPSLIFNILPVTFNAIPGNLGWLWNGLFFILMFIAAFTSGISLLEAVASSVIQQLKFSRKTAVFLTTVVVSCLTFVISFSIVSWDAYPALKNICASILGQAKDSFFDEVDFYCSSWILPLNGLAIAFFAAWTWGVKNACREIYRGTAISTRDGLIDTSKDLVMRQVPLFSWSIFIRYIAPVMILLILCQAIGLFNHILK